MPDYKITLEVTLPFDKGFINSVRHGAEELYAELEVNETDSDPEILRKMVELDIEEGVLEVRFDDDVVLIDSFKVQ